MTVTLFQHVSSVCRIGGVLRRVQDTWEALDFEVRTAANGAPISKDWEIEMY
jgi:hypothetical protein